MNANRKRLVTALRDTEQAIASGNKFLKDLSKASARNEKIFHNKGWQAMADSTVKWLDKLEKEKNHIEKLLAQSD